MMRPPFRPTAAVGPRSQSPRDRVLSQWRGLDVRPLEIARTLRARSTGDLLPKVLAALRINSRRAEAEIVNVWNSVLPPEIIQHAQPTGLRRGTVFVSVDSSVWLSEIVRFRQREILGLLRHSFGHEMIQKLSFRVG